MQLIYDLAIVEDRGSYWAVKGITKNSFDKIADEKHINLSSVAYKIVKDAIENNKEVRIRKTLQTNEVLPGEVDIIENNLNELDYIKNTSFVKIKSLVTPEMTKESGIVLYNFIMYNNELSSNGFFIHNNNREEKYIEIIETGDEMLIELLEKYLESMDNLNRAASFKTRLDEYKEKLNKCSSLEEVKKIEEDFLSTFFANI